MDTQKIKRLSLICFGGLLVLAVVFVIVDRIYYPDIQPLFEVKRKASKLDGLEDYSLLVSKETKKFIGIGIFYPPNHLKSFISQTENHSLFDKQDNIYKDIYTTVDDFLVHIEVIENRRLYFQKVYDAKMSVFCNGYWIQESYSLEDNDSSIDFKEEDEVILGIQNQIKRIIRFYLENEKEIKQIFTDALSIQ
ncbi:hypothetical protein [Candidatus Stoquefichus massiliensis]|uniref:hypothetical protein n=1 Tax=Candidatus Stoquefichus massiliensis TaxID=1470350 RepID=UPI00048963FF|nr:hypothetical protein [Candidatus Stoquefichus massiliensis]